MLYVEGTCAVCDAGVAAFLRCNDGKTIVLMCDECNAVWLRPEHRGVEDAVYPHSPSFEVPSLGLAIGGRASGWATRAEVEGAGWQGYIAGEQPDPVVKRRR